MKNETNEHFDSRWGIPFIIFFELHVLEYMYSHTVYVNLFILQKIVLRFDQGLLGTGTRANFISRTIYFTEFAVLINSS